MIVVHLGDMIMNKTIQEQLSTMNFTINTNQEDTQMTMTNSPVHPDVQFTESTTNNQSTATNKSTTTNGGKTMNNQKTATTKFQKVTMDSIPMLDIEPNLARHYLLNNMTGTIGDLATQLAQARKNDTTDALCVTVWSYWKWYSPSKKFLYGTILDTMRATISMNEPISAKAGRVFDGFVGLAGMVTGTIITGATRAVSQGITSGILASAQASIDIEKAMKTAEIMKAIDPELVVLREKYALIKSMQAMAKDAQDAEKPVDTKPTDDNVAK